MGVDYVYLNGDKRQFFHCGLSGFSSRFSAIGAGPGARALAILLSERGSWRNDRISVVADTSPEFDDVFLTGTDVGVEVELMLLDVDGLDWIEGRLEDSGIAFENVCAYAIHLRRADVIRMLDKTFGAGVWQRKYERLLQSGAADWSQKVSDAGFRHIRLLT